MSRRFNRNYARVEEVVVTVAGARYLAKAIDPDHWTLEFLDFDENDRTLRNTVHDELSQHFAGVD